MNSEITERTILVQKGTLIPPSLQMESQPYSTGWRSVTSPDRKELERRVHSAGWTFFYMAGVIKSTAFGFDQPKARRAAMKRIMRTVESERCNCFEVTHISTNAFLGIPYVTISGHSRHIQHGSVFRMPTPGHELNPLTSLN